MTLKSSRYIFLFFVFVLLFSVFSSSIVLSKSQGDIYGSFSGITSQGLILQASSEFNISNSTRHKDPRELGVDGDLGMVQGWLSGRMGELTIDCTEAIKIGSYEVCDRFNREYPDWLSRYIDISRETENDRDNDASKEWRDINKSQRNFKNQVRETRNLYREYKEKRKSGNTDSAVRTAHKILDLSSKTQKTGDNLTESYRFISNSSEVNLSSAEEIIKEVTENISEISEDIQNDIFIKTNISFSPHYTNISFLDPLEGTGRVTLENASHIKNESVTITVSRQRIETETNKSGFYSLKYRPKRLDLGGQTLTLRYIPDNTSRYLGSTTDIPVFVKQIKPNIRINISFSGNTSRIEIGDNITVSGIITANKKSSNISREIPISSIPIQVFLDQKQIGNTNTDSKGKYRTETEIPPMFQVEKKP